MTKLAVICAESSVLSETTAYFRHNADARGAVFFVSIEGNHP